VPASEGVPSKCPSVVRDNPNGKKPLDITYEKNEFPPDAETFWEYVSSTVPFGKNEGEIKIEGHDAWLIVSEYVCIPLQIPDLSVAITINLYNPSVSGIPEIIPSEDREMPEGNKVLYTENE
jgi:hypothetical protein